MSSFLKEINEKILVFDGSKGTMLQSLGLLGGECPELWNIEHADEVLSIYNSYKQAGANVIQTNTFQGNRLKLEEYGLADKTYELNFFGVKLAKEAMGKDGYVAASIGPLGKLFVPSGDLTFEQAYDVFKEQILAVVDAGADIINFETFTDLAEMRVALICAKENSDLPVICSMAFESNGRTLMGNDPGTCAVVLKSLGADLIGINCSTGTIHMVDILKKMHETGEGYFSVKPNAGLPVIKNGSVVYNETPEQFAKAATKFAKYGARLIGGCCGTTPEFIKNIAITVSTIQPSPIGHVSGRIITSAVKLLNLSSIKNIIIGRIDVNNDDILQGEINNKNYDYIIDCIMEMNNCDAIYISIDNNKREADYLPEVIDIVQTYSKEPVVINTKDQSALAGALRIYKGKAGVIVNQTVENNIDELINIIRKYGGTIVADNIS